MTYVGLLWVFAVICFLGAAFGKEVSFKDWTLPAATERKTRRAVFLVGLASAAAGGLMFAFPNGIQHAQPQAESSAAQPTATPDTAVPPEPQSSQSPAPTADPTSAAPTGSASSATKVPAVNLSDVDPGAYDAIYGGANTEYQQGPQQINATLYRDSIYSSVGPGGSCAGCIITFNLDRKYAKFNAVVGIANSSDPGSVATFSVFVDDKQEGSYAVSGTGKSQAVNIPVKNALNITLQNTSSDSASLDSGNGVTAVWGNPEVSG